MSSDLKSREKTEIIRLSAAAAIFVAALVGLGLGVPYAGWGIAIAFLLAVSIT